MIPKLMNVCILGPGDSNPAHHLKHAVHQRKRPLRSGLTAIRDPLGHAVDPTGVIPLLLGPEVHRARTWDGGWLAV